MIQNSNMDLSKTNIIHSINTVFVYFITLRRGKLKSSLVCSFDSSYFSEIHPHPCTSAQFHFVEVRLHQVIQFRGEEDRPMLSEDILGRELQEHAVDELVFVRHEVTLLGEPVAQLATEQDTAGRHQDEPIQRHGIPVMDVSEPLN